MSLVFVNYQYPLQRYPIAAAILSRRMGRVFIVIGGAATKKNIKALQMHTGKKVKFHVLQDFDQSRLYKLMNSRFIGQIFKTFRIRITFLKSVPYHGPPVAQGGLFPCYFGDGLGIFPESETLPWFPNPPECQDSAFGARRYSVCSPIIFKPGITGGIASLNVDPKLTLLIKSFLSAEVSENRFQAIVKALSTCSHLLFLSTLGGYRTTQENEFSLYTAYASQLSVTLGKPNVFIFPHPHHMGDDIHRRRIRSAFQMGLRDSAANVHVVGLSPEAIPFLDLCAESIANIIDSSFKAEELPVIHSFQTSFAFLRSLYPRLNLKFGYGSALIKTYFDHKYAQTQINFENTISRLLGVKNKETSEHSDGVV